MLNFSPGSPLTTRGDDDFNRLDRRGPGRPRDDSDKLRKIFAQIFRWACYAAWSYVWVGCMFLLMIRELTPYLALALPAALACFVGARALDSDAFAKRGRPLTRTMVIAGFIAAQFLCWRFVYFFRDPERVVPANAAVVSPADGWVVYVRDVRNGEVPLSIKEDKFIPLSEIIALSGEKIQDGVLVGIFMTPMSVHVNRSPVAGAITGRALSPGTRLASMLPMSLRTMFGRRPLEKGAAHILTNERETLRIDGEFPIFVTRIADPYVDKIVTWKLKGATVEQGERLGLIKMGSQTDLIFPCEVDGRRLRVLVKEGDYVFAGSSVLANF